jgi:uncharacterized membrane protein YdjX (TVP38/TMEM64 family)
MNIKNATIPWRTVLLFIVVILISAVLIWLNQDDIWTFVDFVRDREAVITFIDQLGLLGPLVLGGLLGLQVLVPSLPSEPMMIAAGYAYGFFGGLAISWLVSVAASQAVFYLARYAGRPVAERLVPARVLDKWSRVTGERGWFFFLLAFVIPPIPSDIMTYVAGLSPICGRRFLVANLIGRLPLVVLYTLVGANGLRITPAVIAGLTITGVLMLVSWWCYNRYAWRPGTAALRVIAPSRAAQVGEPWQ